MLKRLCAVLFLLLPGLLLAQTGQIPIFPLKDIRPGMHGVGRTIFQGDHVQPFQVEILGVVDNMGPKQSVILAKLSGGPLAQTGVLEGMSGSPVYIDGKLVGAVALGFPFSKDALAGITPIEQMLQEDRTAEAETREQRNQRSPLQSDGHGQFQVVSSPDQILNVNATQPAVAAESAGMSLPEIHTPLVLSGFDSRAIQHFMPQISRLGMVPMMGGRGGSAAVGPVKMGNPRDLHPGDMISVQLMRGDLGVSADGTVTCIDGHRIFAFGHRFLAAGATAMPFTKSSVVALMAGYMTSFKISNPGEPMGVIRQDRSQGVYGTFGGSAPMIPVHVHVYTIGETTQDYTFEMVNHPFLTPFLFNMAIYSTLDATERGVGPVTIRLDGAVHLKGAPDVSVNGMFSGDMNGPAMAAVAAARPLAELYNSGLDGIHIQGIDLNVHATDQKRILTLEQVWPDHRQVTPGQAVTLTTLLRAADGTEVSHPITVHLPDSLMTGPLTIKVSDGSHLDPAHAESVPVRNLNELVHAINQTRRDNEIYVRVERADPGYRMGSEQFPFPPPSLSRALAAEPAIDTNITVMPSSTVLESHSEPLPFVIQGDKSITLTVKDR